MEVKYKVDDEWEWYIGELYTKLIKSCYKGELNTIVELAPGFKYKIANALKNVGFKGTLYVIDSNENVLNYVYKKYSEILPNAKIVCLNKDLEESIDFLPKNIDLFLSNHSIDDMIISEYLSKDQLREVFDNEEASKAKLVDKWEELSKDFFALEKIKNIVFVKFLNFFNSVECKYIIMSQYSSNDYYNKENNYIDIISKEVFYKIKELIEMNESNVSNLLNYYVKEDDDRFKDKYLLNNTQSSNNWIVGSYNRNLSKFDIPYSVNLMGKELFCNKRLYNRKDKLKPLYINEKLYEKIFNKKFNYEEAVDIISNYFSITISEEKATEEKLNSNAFIDFQSDASNIALNGNKGSGRAYYFGNNFNLKGEITPLVTSSDPEYNNGKLPLTSAIHEAMISNVLASNMTPSCFETLAIFDSGETFNFSYENRTMPGGVMIRVIKDYDLYRFSHRFVNNIPFTKEELYSISEIFGKEEGKKFIDRLLHGAWSSGNISIKGNLIDFDTAFYTLGRHPQWSFTNKYKTNYFGYEYLGQLMILESIVNSDLNADNVSIKELEDIVIENRNLEIKRNFLVLMGLDVSLYEKYKNDIDSLAMEFEYLSKKTFANYEILGVNYSKSNMCNIFDFSKFFRYYQILKNQGNCSLVDCLSLLINKEAGLIDSSNFDDNIKSKIDSYFGDLLINDIKGYGEELIRAIEFIKKFDEINELIIKENNIDTNGKAINSYLFNEDRRYLTFEESVRFDLLDLYEDEQISDERIHEIINSVIDFSNRKMDEKLHYCDLILFEEGNFYTVIDGDKFYYEFKCKFDLLDSDSVKLYIDGQEQTINLRQDGCYVFLSTSLKPFSNININENMKKIEIFIKDKRLDLFPIGKLSKSLFNNYLKDGVFDEKKR